MARLQISEAGVALVCVWLSQATYAQQLERNERPAACDQYDRIQVPSEDLPTQDDRSALASCDSADRYFGFGRAADPVRARKCAYLEREKSDPGSRLVFAGPGLLTMIYANGKGATRDFDVALKFSCEVDGAPAENSLRFRHLKELGQQHWDGKGL